MRRNSLTIVFLATTATLVSSTTAVADDSSQRGVR